VLSWLVDMALVSVILYGLSTREEAKPHDHPFVHDHIREPAGD
jgi:hypothetical protein